MGEVQGSMGVQVKMFNQKIAKKFIEICAEVIRREAARIAAEEDEEEDAEDGKEVIKAIAKILETLVGDQEHLIKLKTTGDIHSYVDRDYVLSRRQLKQIYKPIAFGINCLLSRTESHSI